MTGRATAVAERVPGAWLPAGRSRGPGRCACGGGLGPTGECSRCRRARERHEVAAPPTGAGRPLDDATRTLMERRIGHDFSAVRVHDDAAGAASARAVEARAYTVGRDVVFGAGEYRPGTGEGRRLLAHELVHTVQQGAAPPVAGPAGAAPAETGATAGAVAGVLQRDPIPSPDAPTAGGPLAVMQTADRADASCDLRTLCRLRFSEPDVVTDARVTRVVRRCRPGVLVGSSPCLDPAVIAPDLFGPVVPGPGKGPGAAAPTTPPAKSSGGLPDLSGITKFELAVGGGKLSVDLPSSATFNLPVEFRNSYKITFELVAKTSGAFSFSITLDGIPHVQVKSTTTTDVSKKSLKSELTISSTAKSCRAPTPEATKAALQAAGDKLKKAIVDVNKSDAQLEAEKEAAKSGATVTPTPPESFDRVKRLADVVSGIVDVKKAVDKAQEGCKPTSRVSIGITGETPLDPSAKDAVPGTITGGIKVEF